MTQKNEYFYPSNSSDIDYFFSLNCKNCYKKANCSIMKCSILGINPKQWVYNCKNEPVCNSFQKDRPTKKNTSDQNMPKLF